MAQLEDNSSAAQIAAAQQVAASQQAAQGALAQGGFSEGANQGPSSLEDLLKEADEGDEAKDDAAEKDANNKSSTTETAAAEVKIDEADVKLVMEQANCDKEKATKALQEAKGDLIVASELHRTRTGVQRGPRTIFEGGDDDGLTVFFFCSYSHERSIRVNARLFAR